MAKLTRKEVSRRKIIFEKWLSSNLAYGVSFASKPSDPFMVKAKKAVLARIKEKTDTGMDFADARDEVSDEIQNDIDNSIELDPAIRILRRTSP